MHNLHHNIRSLYTTVDVDITQCQINAKDDQFLEGKFTKSNKQISSSVAYSSLDSGSLHSPLHYTALVLSRASQAQSYTTQSVTRTL